MHNLRIIQLIIKTEQMKDFTIYSINEDGFMTALIEADNLEEMRSEMIHLTLLYPNTKFTHKHKIV